jgi:hypothetical protein
MAWHILRKDLGLLWPLVLLSALVQFGLDAMMFVADRTPEAQYLLLSARLAVIVVFLVITLTIAQGVHQEPIPGTRQDWLVRPIRRLDLLMAKLLFVLVAVHLPMFIGDLVGAAAHGFAWPQAGAAALGRNLFVFVTLSLPAFGFAAITRTTAQFMAAGVVYFIGAGAVTFLLSSMARIGGQEQATNPLFWTGVAWIPQAASAFVLAAGAVIALMLLYFRRRIALAWGVLPLFAASSALTALAPWDWIFAVQQAAAAQPSALDVRFDPAAPRHSPAPGENADDYSIGAGQVQLRGRSAGDIPVENKVRRGQGDVTVFVPIRIGGLPPGARPWADRAAVSLRSQAGQVLFQGRGDDLKLEDARPGASPVLAYEAIRIPALVFEAAKDRPTRLEIDYSMTILRPAPAVSAPALGADVQLAGLGRCVTDRDSDGDDIEMRCFKAGRAPSCVSATLQDSSTGRRNPETLICAPDYSPFAQRPFPDAISRFQIETPFRDRLGLAQYPVGGGQLDRSAMIVTRYDASGHLTRHVTAPDVRLSDWTAGGRGAP